MRSLLKLLRWKLESTLSPFYTEGIMEKKRPLGVTLISIYYLLVGSFALIVSLMLWKEVTEETSLIQSIFSFGTLTLVLAVGFGLWRLNNWARYFIVVELFLNPAYALLHKKPVLDLGLLVNMAIVYYLFLWPKSKSAFNKSISQEQTTKKGLSKGPITFAIIFILLNLMGLLGNYEFFSSFFKIPEPYQYLYFSLLNVTSIVGLITVIGLFLLKDSFRKIVIVLISFDLATTVIEIPFIRSPNLTEIILITIFSIYNLAFIYLFTRPKVKEQFK